MVTISNPTDGSSSDAVMMLVDTGADVSVVLRSVLTYLGLGVTGAPTYEVGGFGGSSARLPAVQLKVTFLGRVFRGRFLVADQEYGIIGRNILNAFRLLLDGPALTWNEQL
jgi:hypothetical protein